MKILSSPYGFVLIFESLNDLQGTVENLLGLEGWVKAENVLSPYLYACYDENIPKERIDELLDEIKNESNENK